MRNTIFGCLLLLAVNSSLSAQKTPLSNDFELLQRAFKPTEQIRLTDRYAESRQNPNELQAVLSGLFLLYKNYVSSQDQNQCAFAPSCSEYGLQAVKRYGVIRGGISTMDRLTRCNGLSARKYTVDPATRRLADPVRW
jgi:uncharacterized protein